MRKSVSRILLALLIAAGVMVIPVSSAYACSCADVTPEEYLRAADAVFTGRPVASDVAEGQRVITFRVGRVFKGAVASVEEVATEINGAACGLSTAPGAGPLLLFADATGAERGQPRYYANSCSGTGRVADYSPVSGRFGRGSAPDLLPSSATASPEAEASATVSPEAEPTAAVVAATPEVGDTSLTAQQLMSLALLGLVAAALGVGWHLCRSTGR